MFNIFLSIRLFFLYLASYIILKKCENILNFNKQESVLFYMDNEKKKKNIIHIAWGKINIEKKTFFALCIKFMLSTYYETLRVLLVNWFCT